MEINLAHNLRRVCYYLLDHSVAMYSSEHQAWGRAAAAEVRSMPSLLATFSWTMGGLWVAVRAWAARLFGRPSNLILGNDSLLRSSWRSLSPLLLALSLSLFLVPQFREALHTTTSMWIAGDGSPKISQSSSRAIQEAAERQHDAQTLAFLALRQHYGQRGVHLAEEAVALDQSLTWIFAEFPYSGPAPAPQQWLDRLEKWDPDNAFPYLLQADELEASTQMSTQRPQSTVLAGMRGKDSAFRVLMDRAFTSPRCDSYLPRLFTLYRQVMNKNGLDDPLILLEALQDHRSPLMLGLQTHANWLIEDAQNADAAEAAKEYRLVVRFGERMEGQSNTAWERLTANNLQQLAGAELLQVLQRQGKTDEAAILEYSLREAKLAQDRDLLLQYTLLNPRTFRLDTVNPVNPGIIIHVSALLFLAILGMLGVSLLYLRLRQARGTNPVHAPRVISYAPALLFATALVLLVTYLPYARIFHIYMTDARVLHLHFGIPRPPGSPVPPIHRPEAHTNFDLLSSLSNLQYPFSFLNRAGIHLIVGIAFGAALALSAYTIWRVQKIAGAAPTNSQSLLP